MKALYKGKLIDPSVDEVCVVYDPSDGRVVHTHEVVRFPGAVSQPKLEIAKAALDIAAKLGHDTSKLKTAAVPAKEYDRSRPYKVDLKSQRVVAIEEKPRQLSHALKRGK